mgnify:CR=1 FL=1
MINILPGSHAVDIMTILSVAGEFSFGSAWLFGNDAVIRRLINNMCTPQEIIFGDTRFEGQLLTVSGSGQFKSVRMRKWAYPILKEIEADEYYRATFGRKNFTGSIKNKDRNYRVAECLMMLFRAGIEFRPYFLPKLQNEDIKLVVPRRACFYLSKDLKKLNFNELPKTQFTRIAGLMFIDRQPFAVYNTRSSLMKWNGAGESKTVSGMESVARMNAGCEKIDSALVFYETEKIAIETVRDVKAHEHLDLGFMKIYPKLYLIPLGDEGVRQLKFFLIPKWRDRAVKYLFKDDADLSPYFDFDAIVDGMKMLCFLDGDIARLIRFKNSVMHENCEFGVVCFPHQEKIIREFFIVEVPIRVVTMEEIKKGIKETR